MSARWRTGCSALALCALLAACSKVGGAVAPTFQRMLVQPRYLPYGASAFFPDGRAMRTPPAGTIPRERDLTHPIITTGMENGAIATTIPVPVTADLLATGASRFSIYCAVCHGARGDGRSVVASNMVDCPPPSLLSAAVRALPPGFLYQVIDHGFGRMPSYALQLSVRERWAVIAYIGELQRRELVVNTPVPITKPGQSVATCQPLPLPILHQ